MVPNKVEGCLHSNLLFFSNAQLPEASQRGEHFLKAVKAHQPSLQQRAPYTLLLFMQLSSQYLLSRDNSKGFQPGK